MIDFSKISVTEQQELMTTIQKNVEKSELDKFYLFTINPLEKAKLYIWCCRFIIGISNILENGILKEVLMEEVTYQEVTYFELNSLVYKIEKSFLNKNKNTERLKYLVTEEKKVDEMIDAFSIFLERQNILSMSRVKGIILDGNSGKEFKKVFNQQISETQSFVDEAEIVEEPSVEENPESESMNPESEEEIDVEIDKEELLPDEE